MYLTCSKTCLKNALNNNKSIRKVVLLMFQRHSFFFFIIFEFFTNIYFKCHALRENQFLLYKDVLICSVNNKILV